MTAEWNSSLAVFPSGALIVDISNNVFNAGVFASLDGENLVRRSVMYPSIDKDTWPDTVNNHAVVALRNT